MAFVVLMPSVMALLLLFSLLLVEYLLEKLFCLHQLKNHYLDLGTLHVWLALFKLLVELFPFKILFSHLPCSEFPHQF